MDEPAMEAPSFPLGVTIDGIPIKEAAPPAPFPPVAMLGIPIEALPPPAPLAPINAAMFMKSIDPPAPPNSCAPCATKRCVAAITSGSTLSILSLSFCVLALHLMKVFSTSSVSWRYASISRRMLFVEFLMFSNMDCNLAAFSLYRSCRSLVTAPSASAARASSVDCRSTAARPSSFPLTLEEFWVVAGAANCTGALAMKPLSVAPCALLAADDAIPMLLWFVARLARLPRERSSSPPPYWWWFFE
mmetsp:Transcript_23710/g.50748  ORF Transcript_23710/g.50748 Transcript_23710/m.50748 type:complete len:246 (-) Transcript_23710:136-873(-)